MEIRSVGAEFLYADGRTDGRTEYKETASRDKNTSFAILWMRLKTLIVLLV
jgi:hypothetical protein